METFPLGSGVSKMTDLPCDLPRDLLILVLLLLLFTASSANQISETEGLNVSLTGLKQAGSRNLT